MRSQEDPIHSFLRGSYRILILAMLERSVMHGYEILKLIERLTGHRPKVSTLYSILKDMEGMGLLRSTVEGPRRLYQLTEKGREVLKEFRSGLRNMVGTLFDMLLRGEVRA